MKLKKILDLLNSLEKNAFIKIIDNIIANNPKKSTEIEKILSEPNKRLKNVDSIVISKIFELVKDEFSEILKSYFQDASSQLDIISDIITRDGNCIMKVDWFDKLYEKEINQINKKTIALKKDMNDEKSELSVQRKRDYRIYETCVKTAFYNDIKNNRDPKITNDELSILLTLSKELGLSQEEIKLLTHAILPTKKEEINNLIGYLKGIGVLFYSRKNNTVYIADEIISILRKLRGKEIADKFLRRVLKVLKDSQINLICKKHNINRKLSIDEKIKEIINSGISFSGILIDDIHKEETSLTDRKKFFNSLCEKKLGITQTIKGVTLEEKTLNLIKYYENIEKEEKVGISADGYERMLLDLYDAIPSLNETIRKTFELQDENVISSQYLLDYNIKPRDILDLLSISEINRFRETKDIKMRGNVANNILEAYKDSENIYLENYVNIAFRDISAIKENGLKIKESQLGEKFEDLTKKIFNKLGFNVDEQLRKKLNTKKDKMDILLNLGNNEMILIECKTKKESGFNKFSSVSRQMRSYAKLLKQNGYKIVKSLLIAPEFSDEFINECELEYELNLSLITAESLINILYGFKKVNKIKQLPYKLLLRDVLINEERIIKAINK